MSTLTCPFCGKPATQKQIDLSNGDPDPALLIREIGVATFAWVDDHETAYENNIISCICDADPEHLFFIPQ